jgi:clan AA aspartic protease (TIGR02281 family)
MRGISFFVVMMLLACFNSLEAQNVKRPESYNYQRGLEAMQEEKFDEAIDYFNKDIQENPKNGYSYSWIAHIRLAKEEYGKALTASDLAIKNLPKKDPEYVIFGYSTRAECYLCLEDTVKALADYATAIKVKPDEPKLYDNRAQIYFEQGKYELSDQDYRKMIEMQPGDVKGYMGLGRNALRQHRPDDAISQFNYVVKLDESYSSGYSFRAEAELEKELWNEATTDLLTAMKCQWDQKAVLHMSELKDPAFTLMVSKLKIQAAKEANESTWPYLAAMMYVQNKDYKKALELYKEANHKDASPVIYRRISDCYFELGEYDEALNNVNQAINMDSTDLSNIAKKANIYYEMGNAKAAISEWDKVLTLQPEYGFGYYRRGWFKELVGDMDGALEDLSMAIVLDPEDSYAYVSRGDVYLKQGKKDLAEADFKKVIEIEDSPKKYECIHYAYQGLGQNEKAIEAIDSIIARDEDRAGSYYDAACLYSRMKDKINALKCLEKALELGYMRFAHIDRDFDMDFIRDTEEYKSLIHKYKSAHEASINAEATSTSSKEEVMTEVPFTKENGVCKVKCNVNGLPLHFIFDTGASDVTISMVEATFMMKNGYLSSSDVVGSQRYMDANGDVSVGTIINIKTVNFGGMELTNVRASVVRNQKAPLLLGQSVLGRLGKIEIDNSKNVLKITHNN